MLKAVLDSTVLVSAFLNPVRAGPAYDLLQSAAEHAFNLYISENILAEVADVLLNRKPIRKRYKYSDSDVVEYCRELAQTATMTSREPDIRGAVERDPNDDMIIACALAAGADYIVTRDKDLLSLGRYRTVAMIAPEAFLHVLRAQD